MCPELGRFLSVDPLASKYPGLSPYIYCNNNPLKNVDPDGKAVETAVDVVCAGLSLKDFIEKPSFGNFLWFTADAAAVALPFIPAAGTVRHSAKLFKGADDVTDACRALDNAGDVGQAIRKAPKPNKGGGPAHGGKAHNDAIDNHIRDLPKGSDNIRKNQTQADYNGNKAGNNRPDIQYDYDRKHHNVEIDYNSSKGIKHKEVIDRNDPSSITETITIQRIEE